MSLVNWKHLDQEYLSMKEVLLAKKKPAGKTEALAASKEITNAMEWDSFLERSKGSMPLVVRELLATLKYSDAVRITAVNKFGATVSELWPDIQEEIRRLQADNAKLVEERHEYRRSVFTESLKK